MCLARFLLPEVPVILTFGESNTGGLGDNADLGPMARVINPKALILNNNTLSLEPYYLGVNNQLGHSGISDVPANQDTHGIHYTLANKATTSPDKPTVFIKAGQGGSRGDEWLAASPTGYWSTLISRYNAAISQVIARGYVPRVYVIYWVGVNDAISTFDRTTWRSVNDQVLDQVDALTGGAPILQVKVMENDTNKVIINQEIDSTAGSRPDYYPVEVSNADPYITPDTYHWTSQGYRLIGCNVDAVLNSI